MRHRSRGQDHRAHIRAVVRIVAALLMVACSPRVDDSPTAQPSGRAGQAAAHREGTWSLSLLARQGFSPSFSPDGMRLAYVAPVRTEDEWVWVRELATGTARRIVRGARPKWSPDGKWVAYFDAEQKALALVEAPRDLRFLSPLTSPPPLVRGATGSFDWSPDGRQFVYVAMDDTRCELRIVDVPGGRTKLVAGTDLPERGLWGPPTWSPDATWIACARATSAGDRPEMSVFVTRPDGSGLQRLADLGPQVLTCPTWCGQGSAATLVVGCDTGVLRVDPRSGAERTLPLRPPPEYVRAGDPDTWGACWAASDPGGGRLASVVAYAPGDLFTLCVADGETGRCEPLADGWWPWADQFGFAWHPTGRHIAFTTAEGGLALATAPEAETAGIAVLPGVVPLTYPQGEAAIAGRVTDLAGQPLAGVGVLAWSVGRGNVGAEGHAETGLDGRYVIAGLLAPGTYQVDAATEDGHEAKTAVAAVNSGRIETVDMVIDMVVPTVEIVSPADKTTVHGTVDVVVAASDNVAVSDVTHALHFPRAVLSLEFDEGPPAPYWPWSWLNAPTTYDLGDTHFSWLHVQSDRDVGFSATENDGHLWYQELSGDFVVETKLSARPDTDHQMAGLMVREDEDNWDLLVYRHESSEKVQVRRNNGGTVATLKSEEVEADPLYLKLERSGDDFTSYYSTDGSTWTQHHEWTHSLTDPVKVGLAAASASATDFVAEFDYFYAKEVQVTFQWDTTTAGDGERVPEAELLGSEQGPDQGDSTILDEGEHVLACRAYDIRGNESETRTLKVMVDNKDM